MPRPRTSEGANHSVEMGVRICAYHGQVLMIVQHLDGEAVVAAGGLLADVECLMLSKALTWLGDSGGVQRLGRDLCSPGSPRPLSWTPLPSARPFCLGTTAVSSQTALERLGPLSGDQRGSKQGLVSPGCAVPCSQCHRSAVSGERCGTESIGMGVSCSCEGGTYRGFSSP